MGIYPPHFLMQADNLKEPHAAGAVSRQVLPDLWQAQPPSLLQPQQPQGASFTCYTSRRYETLSRSFPSQRYQFWLFGETHLHTPKVCVKYCSVTFQRKETTRQKQTKRIQNEQESNCWWSECFIRRIMLDKTVSTVSYMQQVKHTIRTIAPQNTVKCRKW